MRDDAALVARDGVGLLPIRALRARDLADRGVGTGEAEPRAVAEDHALKERVRCEAVRPVEPGAGALADGPEARYGGPAMEVRGDAAAHIMGRRDDGDRLHGDINPPAQALGVDHGEMLAHEA